MKTPNGDWGEGILKNLYAAVMSVPEPREPPTYHCVRCEDTGLLWRYANNGEMFSRHCPHTIPSGRLDFPGGTPKAGRLAPNVMDFFKRFHLGNCGHISGHIPEATAQAHALCYQLAEKHPVSAFSASDAPESFDSNGNWAARETSATVICVTDVTKLLRPPQMRAVAELLQATRGCTVITVGQPLSELYGGERFEWLRLALIMRNAKELSV